METRPEDFVEFYCELDADASGRKNCVWQRSFSLERFNEAIPRDYHQSAGLLAGEAVGISILSRQRFLSADAGPLTGWLWPTHPLGAFVRCAKDRQVQQTYQAR